MKTTTAREMLQCVRETGLSLPEVMLRREWELNETPRETVYEKLGTAYRIMREAVEDSLREPHRTMGGLIGGEAQKVWNGAKSTVPASLSISSKNFIPSTK